MDLQPIRTALIGMLTFLASTTTCQGESYPALNDLVENSRLILYGKVELIEDRLLCRVDKVLKGEYRPADFVKPPPTGFVDLIDSPFYAELDAGERVFLFYTGENGPGSQPLHRADLGLIVRDGGVTYPPGDRERQFAPQDASTYTVKGFQKRITAAASSIARTPPVAEDTAEHWRVEGSWKLLLPAGYERDVTIMWIKGNRYRMQPAVLTLSGDYELRGDRLVMIPEESNPYRDYEWRLMSRHMAHLDKQPMKSRPADYDGAVLFRPKTAVPK